LRDAPRIDCNRRLQRGGELTGPGRVLEMVPAAPRRKPGAGGRTSTETGGGGRTSTETWGGGRTSTETGGGGRTSTETWGGGRTSTETWGGGKPDSGAARRGGRPAAN